MATYDYRCDANGRVVEVKHPMSVLLKTWGELCERAGMDLGETSPDSPVSRLITGGQFIGSSSVSDAAPACTTGPCCPTGVCGLE